MSIPFHQRRPPLRHSVLARALFTTVFRLTILTFLSAPTDAEAARAKSGYEPLFFHDKLINSKLLRAGESAINANRYAPGRDLRAQLARYRCKIKLPKPAVGKPDSVELVKRSRPGTLIVSALYKCDQCTEWHTGNATGVALTKDGIFATCYHVIANTNREAFVIMTVGGKTAPVVEILAADEKSDVAICRAAGIELTPIPLAPDNQPVGTPVSVISHPIGSFFTFTTGHVSRYFFKPISDARSVPFMAITAEFAKGSSGAPVLDPAGNIAGLVASTRSVYYQDSPKSGQQNLQMVLRQCVPVSAVRRLIAPQDAD